jgi:hypothetical protein
MEAFSNLFASTQAKSILLFAILSKKIPPIARQIERSDGGFLGAASLPASRPQYQLGA